MLDSFLKSLKTKQEHWSVPEGTCTFAEHRKALKNTSSLSSKQREWDSFRRVYLAIALHRELKGSKSVESGTRMTRIWIPAQLVAQQQWDLPQAPSSFLKLHSLRCRMRGTVTSTSQSCREGWVKWSMCNPCSTWHLVNGKEVMTGNSLLLPPCPVKN